MILNEFELETLINAIEITISEFDGVLDIIPFEALLIRFKNERKHHKEMMRLLVF